MSEPIDKLLQNRLAQSALLDSLTKERDALVNALTQSRADLAAMTQQCEYFQQELRKCQTAGNSAAERLKESARIIQSCLNTGGIRTDGTRQLWDDAHRLLETVNAGGKA